MQRLAFAFFQSLVGRSMKHSSVMHSAALVWCIAWGSLGAMDLTQPLGLQPGLDVQQTMYGTDIIPAEEQAADATGHIQRQRLMRWRFKYPMIQVEEIEQQLAAGKVGPRHQRRAHVGDHLIISVQKTLTKKNLQSIASNVGMTIRRHLGGQRYLLSFPVYSLHSLDHARSILALTPGITAVDKDWIVHASVTPNDSDFSQQWSLLNTAQTGGTAGADIHATQAWALSTGSANVVVGIIDTGIDYTHPDLASNMWVNPGESGLDDQGHDKHTNGKDDDNNGFIDDWHGWDFANHDPDINDGNGDNDPMDDNQHGTHVAGTIGAVGNNAQGISGVCWKVSLVALKFLDANGSGTTSDAARAILYASTLPITLTNNSWSGGEYAADLVNAINVAATKNQLFIAAAGNGDFEGNGVNQDTTPSYPGAYDNANIISVAATDSQDHLATFSNYGKTRVDLAAPGVDILSCQPGGLYQFLSGTSMATPHVSGACALLKAFRPSLTAVQIKQAILGNVDKISALSTKCVSGGRLNVFKAIDSVKGPFIDIQNQAITEVGNGDGLLNPGEAANMRITLYNSGTVSVSAVTAQLTCADSSVTIEASSATYGTMAVGKNSAGSTNFRVRLLSGVVTPKKIPLTLTVSGTNAGPWVIPLTVTYVTTATISGRVKQANGSGVSGASVILAGASNSTITSAMDGSYSFSVGNGTYTLSAQANGFITSPSVTVTTPPNRIVDLIVGTRNLSTAVTRVDKIITSGQSSTASIVLSSTGSLPVSWNARVIKPETGYEIKTSHDSGGPTYIWTDIASTGTRIAVSAGNDEFVTAPLTLGFNMPFYGTLFPSVRICSNGWISFTAKESDYIYKNLPDSTAPENMIAALWRDLDPSRPGAAIHYKKTDASTFVIQFTNVPIYQFDTLLCSFQIVLKSDGTITLYYKRTDMPSNGMAGFQDATRTKGITLTTQPNFLQPSLAVQAKPSPLWLRVTPASGTLAGGASSAMTLNFNTTRLIPGTYEGQIEITSNSQTNSTKIIPVTLTIPSLLVEDTFSYTGTSVIGQNGGTGWANAWTVTNAKGAPYNANTLSATSLFDYPGLTERGQHMRWWTATGSTSSVPPQIISRTFKTPITDTRATTYWMAFEIQESVAKYRASIWLNGYTAKSLLSLYGGNSPIPPSYYIFDDTSTNSTNRIITNSAAKYLFVFRIALSGTTGNNDVVTTYINPNLTKDASLWTAACTRTIDLSAGFSGLLFKSNGTADTTSFAHFDEFRLATTWQAAVGLAAPALPGGIASRSKPLWLEQGIMGEWLHLSKKKRH